MKEKIKKILEKPTEDEIFKKRLEEFRKKEIPPQFNQVKMLDELTNPDIDHFLSISNRTDGKTTNYTHGLLDTVIEYGLGILFLSPNAMLRFAYQTIIDEVIELSSKYERKHFNFRRSHYYVSLDYKDRTIALISDVDHASELKNFSNYLKNFPIIVYDEFIRLESEYLPDEWEKLKLIYTSIDRKKEYPLIKKPKMFYFGNAINFESPVFHGLKMFNILEKHPMNEAKIYKYEFHIMLEMHVNENQNKERNTRAFGNNDALTTGYFETNDFRIATDNDRNHIKRNPRFIYVKLKKDYLRIWFNRDTFDVILSIESRLDESYHYNMQLKDNKEHSIYLNENYFDESHIKKIDQGAYLFDNNYSRNFITSDFQKLNMLKINRLIREFLRDDNKTKEIESKEKQFEENYIEQTKKGLMNKIWG